MAMNKLTFDDDCGTIEIALTPKSDERLFLSMAVQHHQGSGGWVSGPQAMLTKDEAIWLHDQLAQWLETQGERRGE
jgi:hypothetical protein